MLREVESAFQVPPISDLTGDQHHECLRAVHDYYTFHAAGRRRRLLDARSGPQTASDRGCDVENYMGTYANVFRYYHFVSSVRSFVGFVAICVRKLHQNETSC